MDPNLDEMLDPYGRQGEIAELISSIGPKGSTPTPKRKTWQSVLPIAESYVQRKGFPGLKELARKCSCHHRTLRKAIDRSDKLRMAEQRYLEQKPVAIPKRRRQRINAVVADSLASKTTDATESIATDDLFQRAIEAAETDEKRDTLLKMSSAERRELVATVFDDDPDAEFSFKEPKRAPGRARVAHKKSR